MEAKHRDALKIVVAGGGCMLAKSSRLFPLRGPTNGFAAFTRTDVWQEMSLPFEHSDAPVSPSGVFLWKTGNGRVFRRISLGGTAGI